MDPLASRRKHLALSMALRITHRSTRSLGSFLFCALPQNLRIGWWLQGYRSSCREAAIGLGTVKGQTGCAGHCPTLGTMVGRSAGRLRKTVERPVSPKDSHAAVGVARSILPIIIASWSWLPCERPEPRASSQHLSTAWRTPAWAWGRLRSGWSRFASCPNASVDAGFFPGRVGGFADSHAGRLIRKCAII